MLLTFNSLFMKKTIIFSVILLFTWARIIAQVSINDDNSAPDGSAILDVKSTSKGILTPRMTHLQMNDIQNPANGLVVFCSDCGVNNSGALALFMAGGWWELTANCINPIAPAQTLHVPSMNQIVWNWSPVPYASGYKWNTTNDYANAFDMGTATTKIDTGLSCDSSYTRYIWAYNACGSSSPITLTQSTSSCISGFTCGQTLTISHIAGEVAPVSKMTTYGTVTNIPGEVGKCWITSNLGASQQATSVSDQSEPSAGWYWQFNRKQGFMHDGSARIPNTNWISIISEFSDWEVTNDPCTLELGTGWRIPTWTEWANVDESGGWTEWNGPWGSNLHMHAAGFLWPTDGFLLSRGSYAHYWSTTQNDLTTAYTIYFTINFCLTGSTTKAFGFSLRCLKDN
jgi:hypothetical protein